jgi:pimeloyl-ACP methyl ester carboxylesterase
MRKLFWTASGARLQLFHSSGEGSLMPIPGNNWVFLPGGPGLGSESLLSLLNILQLSGNLWRLDLPGDGSNITANIEESFSHWPLALMESVQAFHRVVLVAHSTGGMYVLSLPGLEKYIEGLVLLDSAPNAQWQNAFAEGIQTMPIPEIEVLRDRYEQNPTNEALKALTVASAPYLFTEARLVEGVKLLRSLPYNYQTCQWSEKHFDRTYEAKWVPQTMPTLILSGENDLITPLHLFKKEKRFHRNNILIKSIPKSGHFPWIDNPASVREAFNEYASSMK